MKKIPLTLIVLLSILVVACHNKKEKEAMNKIDKLVEQNEEIKQTLNGSFLDSVKAYHDSIAQMHEFLDEKNVDYIPENNSLRQALHQTSNAEKTLVHYINRHLETFNEKFEKSNTQLLNLKHDIDNKLIEDSLMDKYIHTEDSVAAFLQKSAKDIMVFTRKHFNAYPDRKNDIDSLKSLIISNKQNKEE
jgi:hypothetical protein